MGHHRKRKARFYSEFERIDQEGHIASLKFGLSVGPVFDESIEGDAAGAEDKDEKGGDEEGVGGLHDESCGFGSEAEA
jgi:hypothetical protein